MLTLYLSVYYQEQITGGRVLIECAKYVYNKCFVNVDYFKKPVDSVFAETSILIFMVKPYMNSSEPP